MGNEPRRDNKQLKVIKINEKKFRKACIAALMAITAAVSSVGTAHLIEHVPTIKAKLEKSAIENRIDECYGEVIVSSLYGTHVGILSDILNGDYEDGYVLIDPNGNRYLDIENGELVIPEESTKETKRKAQLINEGIETEYDKKHGEGSFDLAVYRLIEIEKDLSEKGKSL